MKYRRRIYYSDAQKALIRDRWQKDDYLHDIAKLFDPGRSAVQRILRETGFQLHNIDSSDHGCRFSASHTSVILAEIPCALESFAGQQTERTSNDRRRLSRPN